ncbi:relaxase/mobilization nuclease domain-containing protein [Roseomonas mucosa]|uniref:relaxase/mobilization nuclease domain-containing protein n=1 Tax=Roseomonas mucosa TaxID=207340 RepID=UPI001D5B511D|nr:relaxase/mobilization nuclease domain-containing protein [Roseomonas mucosa]MBS5905131.1 relaxase/mobilization nuclease domain-containing protein [Acetobacteraceae bacterium]MDT8291994.1 relaxase/mobilization nuclease domain-containing protein [Roseomonas mucosa]MDT8352431.1 relaxase/mobilization nuclease domain-containing protein [Roseomonas mucosa]
MVPDIARKGHSFKGAFAYYLHDKREPGEQSRATADRVAWAETRNLATDDPHTARRVMIATACSADQLKAAAGVKATGRKSNQHVYAFALSWHPDEAAGLDRAEMVRAADAALKALEADHLQAVIVCHRDTGHPHVHVILNRVDPETGKMHGFSKDREKLSAWAAAYERERGCIVTPARQQKDEQRRKRAQEPQQERPKPAATPSPASTQQKPSQAPENAKATAPDRGPDPAAKSRAAMLAEHQQAQKARHKQEWIDLAASQRARRAAIYEQTTAAIKAAAAKHKEDTRPSWGAFFREERAARRDYERRETHLSGIVSLAVVLAARDQMARADGGSVRGFLSAAFTYSTDRHARAQAFDAHWHQARERTAATLKAPLDERVTELRTARAAALEQARTAFAADRAALIERHDVERGKIREAWRQIYAERGQAPGPTKGHMRGRGVPSFPQQQEQRPVKPEFERSAQLPIAKQSPELGQRVSVPIPAPAPSPAGVPVPPARTVQRVAEADQAKAWAQTPEGQKATAPQKAAPDSLRRAFSPPQAPAAVAPAKVSPAREQDRQPPSPAKEWGKAAQPEQPKPVREWKQEQEQRPKASTPQRGRVRDEWERDR